MIHVSSILSFSGLLSWISQLQFAFHDPFHYYSVWNLLAFFFLRYTPLQFDMALQVAIGGFYMTYISPQYIDIYYLNLQVDDLSMQIMDAIAHQLPFLITLFYYLKYNNTYTSCLNLYTKLPICFYYLIFDVQKYYHIKPFDVFIMVNLYLLSCICLDVMQYLYLYSQQQKQGIKKEEVSN